MAKPKIDASEALRDIRAGVDHFTMMEKYNLSARGLHSLFRKLLTAGVLKRGELGPRYKVEITASGAINDIRSGMSKSEFMRKYRVSPRGLQSLFTKLVASRLIEQDELDEWMTSFDQLDEWLSTLGTTDDPKG
jgi:predicted transcriptional regulator